MSNNDLVRQVTLLKAIADETRLRILGLLATEPRSGRALADALDLTAATVSHHMKRLTDAGVVTATPDAQRVVYALNTDLLREVTSDNPAPAIEDAYQAKTVRAFFDGRRLKQIPAKRRARVAVLAELLRWFEPHRDYTETEVNAILREAHDDVAFLRRELIDYRYLTRHDGIYRVAEQAPERDATEAQEVPRGEAEWLGRLLQHTVRAE